MAMGYQFSLAKKQKNKPKIVFKSQAWYFCMNGQKGELD